MRGLAGVLALGALAAAAAATAAGGPAVVLQRALQRSNELGSTSLTLTESVKVGGRVLATIRISGVEQPRTRGGSFTSVTSPAQTGLDRATTIVHGSTVYVHYPLFDVLQITNPQVKKWLLVDAGSSLGIDPAGLGSLGADEVNEMTGIKVVGTGVDHGVPVTRYRGKLALSKIAQSKAIQDLLASVPSAAAVILAGTETVVTAVGSDGLVHRVDSVITTPPIQGSRLTITVAVQFSKFKRAAAPIGLPPASEVMTMAQWQAINGNGAAAANTALLAQVSLSPAQVGSGYKLSQIPGGKLVQGETTLDFCNMTYRSESLRTARLQVVYQASGKATRLSNEVVTYQSGGAQQALQEVKHAATTCPNGLVASPPAGVTDLRRTTRVITDSNLLPGAVAIVETDTGIVKGKRVTTRTMAVYQVRGDVLSGVYGYGSSFAAVERLTLHAAEQSAADLKRHVSAATGLPTA